MENLLTIISAVVALTALNGYSYMQLRTHINQIEGELHKKIEEDDARNLIADKMTPVSVQISAVQSRIDELRYDQRELSKKLDLILNKLND